jgi:cytochrome P450
LVWSVTKVLTFLCIFMMGSTSILEILQWQVWSALALAVATVAMLAIFQNVWVAVTKHWWMPRRLRRIMEQQGWKGPPFRFLAGSVPDVLEFLNEQVSRPLAIRDFDTVPRVSPQYALFSRKYGDKCFYYLGSELRIFVTDPNLVKEIFSKPLEYSKLDVQIITSKELVGQFSVAAVNGEEWVLHRQLLDPAFHSESIKGMFSTMVRCTSSLLQTWEQKIQTGKGLVELEVSNEMRIISGDIIAHTAFNTNYEMAKQVFAKIDNLVLTMSKAFSNPLFWIPGYRLLPTATNQKIAKLKFEIDKALKQLVQGRQVVMRKGEVPFEEDLLGLMLLAFHKNGVKDMNKSKHALSLQAIADECKTFFLAGSETVALTLTWTLLLLAEYPEWQDCARAEILEVCGHNINNLDAFMLTKMKTVGMIVNEVHRLFTIVPSLQRTATKDMQLGEIFVPKGLVLETSVLQIHRDPKLWGSDALEFNPNRFVDGVAKACQHPQAFLPYSSGPRYCIGQNFANMELKVVLAMVLSQFQLSVSPNYKHHPLFMVAQRPFYGVQLIIKSLATPTL